MKILKRIKETIKSHRELTRLKKELKEHKELLRYMEKRMIEDGWTWDFSGILPKLVKPRRKAVTARFQFVRGADEVKKEVIETIKQELDKAREEGRQESKKEYVQALATGEEMELTDELVNRVWMGELEKIYKKGLTNLLKTKEDVSKKIKDLTSKEK